MYSVGFLQYAPQKFSISENVELVIKSTNNIRDAIIVLPEMSFTSYIEGEVVNKKEINTVLKALLHHSYKNKLSFVGTAAILEYGILRNDGFYINNAAISGWYTKKNLYQDEASKFRPGKHAFKLFKYKSLLFTIQICLDNINPLPAYFATRKKACFIFAPSTVSVDFMRSILKARSLENQCVTVFCNRIGTERNGIKYCGQSAIFMPDGREIAAGKNENSLTLARISEQELSKYIKTRNMLFHYDRKV